MKKLTTIAVFGTAILLFGACGNKNEAKKEMKEEQKEAEMIQENQVPYTVIVTEETIYDVPVPKSCIRECAKEEATKETVKKTEKKETAKTEPKKEEPKTTPATDLKTALAVSNIQPKPVVDTTFFSFSTAKENTTKNVIAYERNGEEYLTVVSDPENPEVIDYIVFTDKKDNTDVYGVRSGMTAKETRQLRRDMKHFTKKGKVFLYSEDSNIVYQLDGMTTEGKLVTDEEIDQMNVSAVIWKDKNHNIFIATEKK